MPDLLGKTSAWMALAAGLLCVAVGLGVWLRPENSVSLALLEQVRQGPGAVVDFAQIAPFAWDRLYIFGPYTPPEEIDACLGFHWSEYWRTSIRGNKGHNLVMFVREGRVVHWFEHPRNCGELEELADPKGYARAEAKFEVYTGSDGRIALRR
jgi:hypothetical protein